MPGAAPSSIEPQYTGKSGGVRFLPQLLQQGGDVAGMLLVAPR